MVKHSGISKYTSQYIPDALWDIFNITPEELKGLSVLESSVYLTRSCNLKCQYCKIIKTELPKELTIDEWIEAMDVLEDIGIKFVNIAGGEPTVLEDLPRLIKHLSSNTKMDFSIVSNSLFGAKKAEDLVDAGLKAYIASVDVLGGGDMKIHDLRKSSAGLNMLVKLKELGVPYLCANIVISATNIDNVMDVVKFLSAEGIWVNICPIIWGKGDKWDEIEIEDERYRLGPEHVDKLKAIASELIEIKRDGALILPTEPYLEGLPSHGVLLDWRCCSEKIETPPPRLTIDADGSMMSCINMRGDVAEKYKIFDMRDKDTYNKFLKDWWEEAKSCDGCYWSTMVMASERQDMLTQLKNKPGWLEP